MHNQNILMIGPFSGASTILGGQTVKLSMLREELAGQGLRVDVVDTSDWRQHPARTVAALTRKAARRNQTVLICATADSALSIIPGLMLLRRFLSFRLVYLVVGYALLDRLDEDPSLCHRLSSLDAVLVETMGMREDLERYGLRNAVYIPNMRPPLTLQEDLLSPSPEGELKLVFFSRVIPSKGVATAAAAVQGLNRSKGIPAASLDIYGVVPDTDRPWLETLLDRDVSYGGMIDHDRVPQVLSQYNYLVFPTYYSGEVYPGVVLEAAVVGLPTLISNWHYNAEVVSDGQTGFVLPVNDVDAWQSCMESLLESGPALHKKLSENCLHEAASKSTEFLVSDFVKHL